MRELFTGAKIAAYASPRAGDTLVIGISMNPELLAGRGQITKFHEQYGFSFSFVDIAAILSFPHNQDDVWSIVRLVREYAKDFRRVVLIGSSAGAFACLNFGGIFNADAIIVASPLYSINPAKMPNERRWKALRDPVTEYIWDDVPGGLAQVKELYVLFDPLSPDATHVAAIAHAKPEAVLLPIICSGHPSFSVLNHGGTLGRVIEAIVDQRFTRDVFREALKESRPRSALYLKKLAAAQPAHRDALKVRLLEKAYAIDEATETRLEMLPPLVRLGRMRDVRLLTRAIVDDDAELRRQKRELRERYDQLKAQLEETRAKLGRSKKRG